MTFRPARLHPAPNKAEKPFFAWINFTHMHFRTHAKPESLGQAGVAQSFYHDTMIDHDRNVGSILELIDQLSIAENTIVLYSTDNGPHRNSWPDAGTTCFRSEKNTGWEGAYRVPAFIRWPGKIKAGSDSNEIMSHLDWAPTSWLLRASRTSRRSSRAIKAGDKTYKVHLDGYNFLPYLTGQEKKCPRDEFFYFSDEGDLMALRYKNWKVHSWFRTRQEPWKSGSGSLGASYALPVQPPDGPLRVCHGHLEHLLGLVHRSRVGLYPLGDAVGDSWRRSRSSRRV